MPDYDLERDGLSFTWEQDDGANTLVLLVQKDALRYRGRLAEAAARRFVDAILLGLAALKGEAAAAETVHLVADSVADPLPPLERAQAFMSELAGRLAVEAPVVIAGSANEYVGGASITIIPDHLTEATTLMHLFLHYAFDLLRRGDLQAGQEEELIALVLGEEVDAT